MTLAQKSRITYLRGSGESCAKIAAELNISENTVKSFCRRNKLGAASTAEPAPIHDGSCGNCGKPVSRTAGAKMKRFCSDKCRMAWWNAHPEAVNRKAVYRFVCPVCDTEFQSYGNAKRKYCSRACFGSAGRVSDE